MTSDEDICAVGKKLSYTISPEESICLLGTSSEPLTAQGEPSKINLQSWIVHCVQSFLFPGLRQGRNTEQRTQADQPEQHPKPAKIKGKTK